MRSLTVTSGPAAGQTVQLDQQLLIGRENADVTLDDPEVSRRHAYIRPVGEGVVVEDLDSTNGTLVNGSKIDGAVTLSESGTVQIGGSRIEIEIPKPVQATAARAVPQTDGATQARPVVPEQDATQARPVATPPEEQTRTRDLPREPAPVAASTPPPVVAPPPAAAPPPVAQPAAPTTEQQPAAAAPAGPPPIAARAPAAAQPVAPDGAGPPGRSGGLPRWLPGLLVFLVVAAVAVIVIVSSNNKSKVTEAMTGTMHTVLVSQQGPSALFAGLQTGSPGGQGAVTIDQVFSGQLKLGGAPVPVSAKVVSRFDRGSIRSTLQANAMPQKNGSVMVVGKGKVTGGTGDFKNATGSYNFSGGRPKLELPNATFTIKGTITYEK